MNEERHADFELIGTGDDELDWRLHAYIAARLSPTEDASRRMRRAVVARAADAAAIRAFEAERLALQEGRRLQAQRGLSGFLRLYTRRGAAAFLAGSMIFGSSVAVLAATPSSPLYGARIWLETSFLPTQADARAAAHVTLLEVRVEDAEHAAGGGDPSGVAAALAAYRAEIDAAIRDADGDPARLAALRAALGVHVLLLEQLEASAPAAAQNAIHAAINDSRKATKALDASKPTVTAAPQAPDGEGGQNTGGQEGR